MELSVEELEEIKVIMQTLQQVSDNISTLALGDVPICDSNGNTLGKIVRHSSDRLMWRPA